MRAAFKKQAKDFLLINAGVFLTAFGIAVFRNPNNFAFGGVSGLSVILFKYLPNLPIGAMMLVLNILLLIVGYIFLGRELAAKGVYGSFALSGMVWILGVIFPLAHPLTNQKLLELLYGVFLPGVGSALVFQYGATTGGTDIIAKILNKRFKMKTSIALLASDFLIAAAAGMVFGVESGLFSILGVCMKSFVMDLVFENVYVNKIVTVVSDHNEEIREYVVSVIGRGATIYSAHGGYSDEKREVVRTVLGRRQTRALLDYIAKHDPAAFVTVTNSARIIGKGFERFE